MRNARLALALLLTATLAAQSPNQPKGGQSSMAFTVTSPVFASGAVIPNPYTCQGADISPALNWSGQPTQAISLALVMDDPDAPAGPWVHWVMWNIPATTRLLAENVPKQERLGTGAMQGRNDFGKVGYNGPCPPPGHTHRYFFRLYALDVKLTLPPGTKRKELDAAMQGHIVAHADYMGTYRR
jgi:Raf kinase inhibitor-like YbhB/YbcL family protein